MCRDGKSTHILQSNPNPTPNPAVTNPYKTFPKKKFNLSKKENQKYLFDLGKLSFLQTVKGEDCFANCFCNLAGKCKK